jgi:signal transduction histidine kinase
METIGRIAGGVAHDFNNLLTVIISNLEIIRLKPGDVGRVEKLTAAAMGAAESGAALIRQLLTFARRDMTRPRRLAPNTLLLGMEDLLRRTVGRDIEFALMLDAEAGEALVDPGQFESAMINLVLNAREAIGGGKGRIVITTRRAAEDMLAVDVTDTGCGMTPEIAAQAFEPFFTTKPVGTGPGLGLSQVYGFAEGAGGRVTIDSTPGAGTTVTLLLAR